ncbi:MAG TPA: G1 family glutamic endopeptidase [Chloroflexota bacterium]|nr:G1 family glutamic endopeptidase [Chloroflexota bacterium]
MRAHRLLGAAVAALLTLLASTAAAQAAPINVGQLLKQPNVLPTRNWSGYVGTNAYYTGVSSLLQAPQPATAAQIGMGSSWIGIGGAEDFGHSGSPNTPLGDDPIQAGVSVGQFGPVVAYYAWYEMLPPFPRVTVMDIAPGDWVQVDIHEQAFDSWQITIVDGTQVFQQTFPYQSSHSSAEWIFEAPYVPVTQTTGLFQPLEAVAAANFTRMYAIANGQQATAAQLFPKEAVLLAPPGAVSAIPLALNPDGTSFTDTTGIIRTG